MIIKTTSAEWTFALDFNPRAFVIGFGWEPARNYGHGFFAIACWPFVFTISKHVCPRF